MDDKTGTVQAMNSGGTNQNTSSTNNFTRTFDPGIMGLAQQLAGRGVQSPEALQTLQQNAMNRQNDTVWGAQLTNSRNAVANLASGHDAWAPTQGLQDFASGKYLSPETNPWLKGMYNDAANSVMGQLRGQFSGLGRYGSGAMAATQGDTLNKLANTFYGNAYQSGMQNMFGANTAINQGNLQSKNQQLAASALLPSAGIGNDAQLMQLAGLQQGALNGQYGGIGNLLGNAVTGTTGTTSGMNSGTTSGSNQTPYYAPNDFMQGLAGVGGLLSVGQGLLGLGGKVGDLFSGWGGGGADTSAMNTNWGGAFGTAPETSGLWGGGSGLFNGGDAGSFFNIPSVPDYNFDWNFG